MFKKMIKRLNHEKATLAAKFAAPAVMIITGVLVANTVNAETGAIGTWQTESSEKGYLHVAVEQCEEKLCGTILQAYDTSDKPIADYEHIGEKMIWNMNPKSDSSWAGGRIWDPSEDKTYKSKMSVNGNILSVSGCIFLFCKAQDWIRVM